jgi:hypothetical protein
MTADSGKSLEKPTISSERKRQRTDEEHEVEKENTNMKKPKTAAARVELEIAAERPIWEMDTDAEEDCWSRLDKTPSTGYVLAKYLKRKDIVPRI